VNSGLTGLALEAQTQPKNTDVAIKGVGRVVGSIVPSLLLTPTCHLHMVPFTLNAAGVALRLEKLAVNPTPL
jgi:hypothetical protein